MPGVEGKEYFKRRRAFENAKEAYSACQTENEGTKFDEFEKTLKQEGFEIRSLS